MAARLGQSPKNFERRISAFEFRCYCGRVRIPYTAYRTNHSVLEEVTHRIGLADELIEIVKLWKLKWLNQVVRANNTSTIILERCIDCTRGQCGPKRGWLDDVTSCMVKRLTDLRALSHNNVKWRQMAHKAPRIDAPMIVSTVSE